MAETRYRHRLPPCAPYDIPAMESWLEDMASRGLHIAPDGFFLGFATFEEGAPRKEKFRLEATATQKGLFSNEYEPDPDVIDLHRQMGWTYRARRDQFHIYSSTDPNAPELNTDPQVQAYSIAALSKFLRKALFDALLMVAIYVVFHFGDMIVSTAVNIGSWWVALLAGLLLCDLIRKLRAIATLSRYKKQLENGEPLPHRADYRRGWKYHVPGILRKALWVLLLIVFLTKAGSWITEENYVPLDGQTFPFATLQDLYPNATIERQQGLLESEVLRWSDPLAPENYDFTEWAQVTIDGKTSDYYLTVEYHELRFEWTARLLARELLSQSGANVVDQTLTKLFGDEPTTAAELILPDADYAATFYLNRDEPTLILQHNNTVLRIHLDHLGGRHEFTMEELAQAFLSHLR